MVVTHGHAPPGYGPCAWTIGNFDGVHLGHQAMLARVVGAARDRQVMAGVLTFEPHPREYFASGGAGALLSAPAPGRLSRLREKLELFEAAGIDRVHVARFDRRFAALQPDIFVSDVMVRGLQAVWLMVGRDFRFGAGRAGDFDLLGRESRRHGFVLEAMPEVAHANERVSSSSVRHALERGRLDQAAVLLGRHYSVSGRVAHGAKLGRELGFPTANLILRRRAPLAGVFIVEVHGADADSPDRWLPGVASVGTRPTVNEVPTPLLEVHLFDFSEELYGRHLRVRFLAKLRDEEKYPDLATLREAIARDVAAARAHFAPHG